METIAEAIHHAVSRQNQLMLDPIATLIVIGVVVTIVVLRVLGKRKSTRQRIAEMEDADFPVDDEWPADDAEPPRIARTLGGEGAPPSRGQRGRDTRER